MQIDTGLLDLHLQQRMQELREEKSRARQDASQLAEIRGEITSYRDLHMRLMRGDFNVEEEPQPLKCPQCHGELSLHEGGTKAWCKSCFREYGVWGDGSIDKEEPKDDK